MLTPEQHWFREIAIHLLIGGLGVFSLSEEDQAKLGEQYFQEHGAPPGLRPRPRLAPLTKPLPPTAIVAIDRFLESCPPLPSVYGRGIVTSAGGRLDYLLSAYVMFRLIRELGCKLPIECWYAGSLERHDGFANLVAPMGVTCRDAVAAGFVGHPIPQHVVFEGNRLAYDPDNVHGYSLKPFAICASRFAEVVWLDADCHPIISPCEGFNVEDYIRTGALVWPDNPTATFHYPRLDGFGLVAPPGEHIGWETGQMVVDKLRHWRALQLANWFCTLAQYWFRYSFGDKDCFFAGWLHAASGYSTSPPLTLFEGQCFHHTLPDGRPYVLHRAGSNAKLRPQGEMGHDPLRDPPHKQLVADAMREFMDWYASKPATRGSANRPPAFTFPLAGEYSPDVGGILSEAADNAYSLPDDMRGITVVDIGAHIGIIALDCLRRGAKRVICVEPDPVNYANLTQNLAPYMGPRVVAWNCAAWTTAGVLPFRQRSGAQHSAGGSVVVDGSDRQVPAVPLDTFLTACGIRSHGACQSLSRLQICDWETAKRRSGRVITVAADSSWQGDSHYRLTDDDACDRSIMLDAVRDAATSLLAGPVTIHCMAGVSRSVAVAAAAVALAEGITIDVALELICQIRPQAKPVPFVFECARRAVDALKGEIKPLPPQTSRLWLKLDCEGAERFLLTQCDPLPFERIFGEWHWGNEDRKHGPPPDDCWHRLRSLGYTVEVEENPASPGALGLFDARRSRVQVLATNTLHNTGDRACLPNLYFDLGKSATLWLGDESTDPDGLLIVGGGGLFRNGNTLDMVCRSLQSHRGPKVLWGAGLNNDAVKDDAYPSWLKETFSLVGVRDVVDGLDWVPCVSCMSPLLDRAARPVHDVVVYHGAERIEADGQPEACCEDDLTLEQAVDFLLSGSIVVTSSYHGWYWATLLGRPVVLVPSHGNSKFYRLPVDACYADGSNWRSRLAGARSHHRFLDRCRQANIAFRERVIALRPLACG